MNRESDRFVMGLFIVVLFVGFAVAAFGQDHHHPLHEHFYSQWKQPGTETSCCNARIEINGKEVGDCEPTRGEVRNGAWWAWLRQESRWIEIPEGRVIRERNPTIEDAHLCWTPASGVLCFKPPDTGG